MAFVRHEPAVRDANPRYVTRTRGKPVIADRRHGAFRELRNA